jgi:hypothetical protein
MLSATYVVDADNTFAVGTLTIRVVVTKYRDLTPLPGPWLVVAKHMFLFCEMFPVTVWFPVAISHALVALPAVKVSEALTLYVKILAVVAAPSST